MRRFVVVDLDGTLTSDRKGVPYPDKPLNGAVARAVHAARGRGFGVMVHTARGMRTWKNDRALVEQHVRPGVEAWLELHGLGPDQVEVGKPWCGPRGFYVDDRGLHPEEFVFRFTGPWAGQVVEGVVRGRAACVHDGHVRLMRAERWLDVCRWRYLDDTRATEIGDALIDEGDGRAPTWTLVIEHGESWVDPAGYFAFEAERLTGDPVVVRRGAAGFALVPSPVANEVGPELDSLASALGSS